MFVGVFMIWCIVFEFVGLFGLFIFECCCWEWFDCIGILLCQCFGWLGGGGCEFNGDMLFEQICKVLLVQVVVQMMLFGLIEEVVQFVEFFVFVLVFKVVLLVVFVGCKFFNKVDVVCVDVCLQFVQQFIGIVLLVGI